MGLTGSSGALPIWNDFMKRYIKAFSPDDFPWPESTTIYKYEKEDLEMFVPELAEHEKVPHFLIFRKGNEP